MITRVIAACAHHPVWTLLVVVAGTAWGALCLARAPLDAIPDLSDVQVIVFTEWAGRSPDQVEDQITYPISTSLLAAPGVKAVRGQSMFGMSFVYVVFQDDVDPYWARSRVVEYLQSAQARMPAGTQPTIGPDATGVGWVFQYALVDDTGAHDLAELRALQDWNVRYALSSVPGVAEVAAIGGYVKELQVSVDPARLRAAGLTLDDVARAARDANVEVSGRALEIADHEHVVRGRGRIESAEDLRNSAIGMSSTGAPIRIGDVADVAYGPGERRGLVELDGRGEVVGGVVIVRYGQNALAVANAVKERLEEVRRSLPPGVRIVVAYDRSELIERAVATLQRTLLEEMLVVALIIFLFLLHVRTALIPIITLPVAVLMAFVPMYFMGTTANMMWLGGIAVAGGAMVDASIILVENVHNRLTDEEGRAAVARGERTAVIVRAMQEVGPSIFFALLVVTASFLPVFTLTGTEGRLFGPLAATKTWSMAFAAILAVTATPALAVLLIRGKGASEDRNPLNRWLSAAYAPVVRFVVRARWFVIVAAALAVAATVPVFLRLGTEFMPPLNEGVILYMPSAPPGMSMTAARDVLIAMDAELKKIPEVQTVFGKMGRAETATDPAPIGMAETTIQLKPKEQWRPGLTWEQLVSEMDQRVRFPGMPNIWWMPIQTRTEMLTTGVRSPLGIQVLGPDLRAIEAGALAVEAAVQLVPGTRSAFAERSMGGAYVDVVVDRPAASRLGVRASEIGDVVSMAVGGARVAEIVSGRARIPITVRYARELRDDPAKIEAALVTTPTGATVPLSQVAHIEFVEGPPMLRSEAAALVGYVFVDTNRPIADYVEDARRIVSERAVLPPGTRLNWVGQFEHFERAKARLVFVVPLTLLLVALLLFLNMRSIMETLIVLMAVPFSLIGAIWLLWFLDYNMSVAVWVGLIALAGLDAETGVIMLLYLTIAHRTAAPTTAQGLEDAIVEGAARRIRPKLMTVACAMIGLTPILWSDGTGADVMKRVAAPMVGGLATSFLLELLVYPALFAVWKMRGLPKP